MVRPYTRTVAAAGPAGGGLAALRIELQRRQAVAERSHRQFVRERNFKRNLCRAGVASGLLVLAVSTAFFASVVSRPVAVLFAPLSKQEVLAIADGKRTDLRTGRVLFAQPDGETCRPMYFDNKTGEMSPGAGMVPCHSRDADAAAHLTRFNWRGGK